MKAQERHELRENDLAGWFQYGLWAFLKQNGSYLLLGASLLFLGYQVWNYYTTKKENERLEAWRDFNTLRYQEDLPAYVFSALIGQARASTAADKKEADAEVTTAMTLAQDRPNSLRTIIDNHPDIKPLQAACYLSLGNYYLNLIKVPEVLDMLKLSHTDALAKAADAFQGLLKVEPEDAMMSAQAHLGLAAVYEDQGEWDKARDEYKILTATPGIYADTQWAVLASQRASELEDRRNAPRLSASMSLMKPAAAPTIATPPGGLNLLGPTSPASAFPGISLNPAAPTLPTTKPATSAPASPLDSIFLPKPAGPARP